MIISHIHVWDKKNKGDQAIVLAVQEQIRARWPKAKIIDYPVETLSQASSAILKRINASDLVIIGGGGLFYSYFLPFDNKIVSAIKPPIILFGLGYIREIGAPALSQAAAKSAVYLAKRAAKIGVRDYRTRKFLRDHGLKGQKIEVIGDPALLLEEKKTTKFIDSRKLKIGLNLNYSGWLGFGRWRNDILRAYQETAEYFQKRYGAQIYYLQHHPGEKDIYPALGIKNLKFVNLGPREQKYAYSRLDLVIGMMLHAGVLAAGALTPEISVAYDLRNHSFAQFLGCPELVVKLEDLKKRELLERAKVVLARRKDYKDKFSLFKNEIKKRQHEFLGQIKCH